MNSVFKDRVEIQVYNKPLCEWTLYRSKWNPRDRGVHVMIPGYQRDFVWKEEDYQSFIETIFDRIQLPPVYIDSRHTISRGLKYIIDGKHRIKALQRFFNDDLRVRGKLFSELSDNDQIEFEDTLMPVLEVELLSQKQIIELYLHLNFKAVPHTQQDREKALNILASIS